jgi:hypothetical protein
MVVPVEIDAHAVKSGTPPMMPAGKLAKKSAQEAWIAEINRIQHDIAKRLITF